MVCKDLYFQTCSSLLIDTLYNVDEGATESKEKWCELFSIRCHVYLDCTPSGVGWTVPYGKPFYY